MKDIPCPFLRALAAAGHIGAQVPLGPFAELVVRAGALRGGDALRLRLALPAVGAVANEQLPLAIKARIKGLAIGR